MCVSIPIPAKETNKPPTSQTMSFVAVISITFIATIASLAWLFRLAAIRSNKNLPPGPRGLPIIGVLHSVGPRPYRDFAHLARTYGPIMYLQMGCKAYVILSTPAVARELIKDHDLAFAGRPLSEASDVVAYSSKGLGLATFGPYWRAGRRLAAGELLSTQKLESSAHIRREELMLVVETIKEAARAREAVDVTAELGNLVADMACRMVLGSKGEEGEDSEEVRGLRWAIRQGTRLLAMLNVGDYMPFTRFLDLHRVRGQMKEVREKTDKFLDRIIERRRKHRGKQGDYVDVLLEFMEERGRGEEEDFEFELEHVKVLTMEMISTMIEPLTVTVEWALIELLRHPDVMAKVRAELERVVGLDRTVQDQDIPKLHYLDIVIKESMRLHTPLPILIPRICTEERVLRGYRIPKHAQVIINAWGIQRDPAVWPEPEKFWPERFLGVEFDIRGHDFRFMPFGTGRRICPGMQLGLSFVPLVVAQLVHCFDWELPGGASPSEMDMEEMFNVTAPRVERLIAIPTSRLFL